MYQPTDQHIGDWMQPGNFFGTPVDYEAKDMNPWRKSILQILVGIALYTVTVDYLALDILLPVVGVVLMYLGLRTLRRENRWFFVGNLLVCVQGLWGLADIFFTGSALNAVFHRSAVCEAGWWICRMIQLGVLLCLRQGMAAVFTGSGRRPRVKWVTVLMILTAAAAVLQSPGMKTGYLLIGVYAGILWTLYRLAGTLERVGYEIISTPAALSDPVLAGLLIGLAAVTALGGSCILARYPMEWTAHTVTEEQRQIAGELTGDAAVTNILMDLTPEDILACRGGTVEAFHTDTYTLGDDAKRDGEMIVSTLYIRLPGEGNRWKVIHHFRWTDMALPTFHYGTECLAVYLEEQADTFTGQVLRRDGKITFRADPAEISVTPVGVYLNLSFPKKATRARGYLGYELTLEAGAVPGEAPKNRYLFQTDSFRFPAVSAQEQDMNGPGFDSTSNFRSFGKEKE